MAISISNGNYLTPDEADEFLTLEEASKVIPGRPHKNTILYDVICTKAIAERFFAVGGAETV